MNVEMGNKIIAEFMGWQHHEDMKYDEYEMSNLKYHSDWRWLLAVIERIESLGYEVFISKNACYISKPNQEIIVHCNNWENKITTVYQAVESFSQWYINQQKQKV